jgi:hypothetical protein
LCAAACAAAACRDASEEQLERLRSMYQDVEDKIEGVE